MKKWTWNARVASRRLTTYPKYLALSLLKLRNPIEYLTVQWKNENVLLHTRGGLRFEVRPGTSDRAMFSEVVLDGQYDNPERFENEIVVDIGANVGSFTVLAARFAAKVIALEPLPDNFKQLQRNIEFNSLHNVSQLNVAISDTDGELEIFGVGACVTAIRNEKHTDSTTVKAITMQTLMDEYSLTCIDFLKMDCEGSEFDVFLNSPPEILRRIKSLNLEFHNISDSKNDRVLVEFFKQNKFKLDYHSGGSWNGILHLTNLDFQPAPLTQKKTALP